MRGVAKPYEEIHKNINGIEFKMCSICNKWFPMTNEYFYKNKSNYIDGFNPYCKECTKKKSAKWEKENPEKRRIAKRRYDTKPERKPIIKETSKRFRDNGGIKIWQQNNPSKMKKYSVNRGMNKTHIISNNEWENCKNYFNYRCAYCGLAIEEHYIKFNGKIQLGDFHREHVDSNGANDLSNCIPSCKECNVSKRTIEFNDWYSELNSHYTKERYDKIIKWLKEDYKLYIQK